MEVQIFGRQNCGKCSSIKHKVEHLIQKLGLGTAATMAFFDMDTADGMAEGAFYDVHEIPTTIIKENGRDLVRWDGEVPDVLELSRYFAAERQAGPARVENAC